MLSICFILIQIRHQFEKNYVLVIQMLEAIIGLFIFIITIKMVKSLYKMEKPIYQNNTSMLIIGISIEFLTFIILCVSI